MISNKARRLGLEPKIQRSEQRRMRGLRGEGSGGSEFWI